ncbi:hypothetical protein ABZZ47_12960 [Streptomyces sp. NPDC006465]|uniref:hypothetical protein n=1 Tax=Streptomyces sp. NPDC006465 TaxID=3157174 RepID=UPI0033BAF325
MSYNQPPPAQPPIPGQAPFGPPPGQPTPATPKWARKRVAIPAALLILFFGVGIGSSGSDGKENTGAAAKPQPTVTVTKTAAAKTGTTKKAEPQPTVTVTRTKTAKPKADSGSGGDQAAADEGPSGKVVFKVWGSAPAGVDITYGSDSDNRDGSGLPMTKTLTLDSDAMYYHISAQLQGGGDINCSVTVDGETKKGHASGSYNICMAQLNSGLLGGWD